MRAGPATWYECDCGDPAVEYYRGEPVCARCRALAASNPADALTCGRKETQAPGFQNSAGKSYIDWEHYWLGEDFGKPIAGDSLNALPMLEQMWKNA